MLAASNSLTAEPNLPITTQAATVQTAATAPTAYSKHWHSSYSLQQASSRLVARGPGQKSKDLQPEQTPTLQKFVNTRVYHLQSLLSPVASTLGTSNYKRQAKSYE